MVNFKKPTKSEFFPYSVSAIFCHFIGYNIVRAILLDNSHSVTDLNGEEIEYIFYIFTQAETISLFFASIIIQLFGNKFHNILTFTIIWTFVLGIFHRSITTSSAILVAVVSSFVKVGLVSYGAGEYDPQHSSQLYVYFLFYYLSTILSELASIYYVPPNANWKCKSLCFGMSFRANKIIVSIIFGVACTTLFYISKFRFEYPDSTKSRRRVSPTFVATKMVYILIIISPFVIIWILQKQIVTNWPIQAYLTTPEILSYIFDRDYVHFVYLWCIVIYVSIFYVFFYKKYSKCLTSNPFIAITIGCIFMSFAAVTTRQLETGTKLYTNKLLQPNVSWLLACARRDYGYSITTNYSTDLFKLANRSCKIIKFELDSPYEVILLRPDGVGEAATYTAIEGTFSVVNRVTVLMKNAPTYYNPKDTAENRRTTVSTPMTVERIKSGLPTVCVSISIDLYSNAIIFYKISSIDQRYVGNISYYFLCTSAGIYCKYFAPGIYRLQTYLKTTPDNCNEAYFEMGGVYVVSVATRKEYTDIMSTTLVGPLEISILWLLFPIIKMAVGRTLIEVTGIYIIYTQSHPLFKTISIGCWMVIVRSGDLVNGVYNRRNGNSDAPIALKNVSHIFLYTTLFFFCMAILRICCFKANWDPSAILRNFVIESINEAEEKKAKEKKAEEKKAKEKKAEEQKVEEV